ncbi:hypothetical protein ABWJ92_10680 [Streptomyces sp. NPDC000609]|uniref:hypothetical protein n=1 Tax=Streptomyces sp. NPDC000609 TaxID=3160957 RepID=UPI003395C387
MRRQMLGSNGRRGTVIAASAAVLCLGGVLAACGGGTADEGHVALGAAGTDPGRAPAGARAPSGKVTLVPLDRGGEEPDPGGGGGGRSGGREPAPGASGRAQDSGATSSASASGGTSRPSGTDGTPGTPGTGSSHGGTGSAGGPGGGSTGSTGPTAPSVPGSPAPGGPAELTVGAPVRAAADERWCEKVTVEFRNTGGSAARSGTVTFATHVIGALGVDWATIESTGPLPAPIDAGAARTKTYTVCVDAWRVPLGMHVETRDVTAVLK